MTKVVITGGAGFIGSHVSEHFARQNHDVVVCDNLSRHAMLSGVLSDVSYNWNRLKRHPRIRLMKVDVRDFDALAQASKSAEIVVHAAGQVAVTASLRDPRTDFENNALGTFNVLEVARQNDCAVVFCSTNKVYGDNVNCIPTKENEMRYSFSDPELANGVPEDFSIDRTGHTPYGSSKLAGDIYVQDYAHTYGLKTGVFRLSCVYGDHQFGVEDQGWVAWFTIATLTGKPVTIYGNGKQVRDVLYVGDLVDAFDRFLEGNITSDVFNIGGGPANTISILELLQLLHEFTGKQPEVSFGDWRQSDQKIYVSDIRKAQSRLGWKPSVNPREGVRLLADWVGQNLVLFR
jgi:CDP-paratose 2-epimerase